MATVAVHTPIKSHSKIFSTKAAGGRMPLTPSPRHKQPTANLRDCSPFTPPRQQSRRDVLAQPTYTGSLASHFSSMSIGSAKKVSYKNSPKSSIARNSPVKLELGVSDWALTGTGTTLGQTPVKKRKAKTTIRAVHGDRFIPNRMASSPTGLLKAEKHTRPGSSRSDSDSVLTSTVGADFALGVSREPFAFDTDSPVGKRQAASPGTIAYEASIADACGLKLDTRILQFKPTAPESTRPIDLRSQYNRPLRPASAATSRRRVLTAPERVLDAPGLVDDYYLNLLDWGSGNQVAIGLERSVYIWNASTGTVNNLFDTTPDTHVTSVKWSHDGSFVAVGLGTGEVQIWDPEDAVKVRSMHSHSSRVGVMSWNKHLLSTGSRSGEIINHDVRIADHKIGSLVSHTSEVCGLEWRADGAQLASGGNDNLVNIWDARAMTAPRFTKTNHKAAVKALAWCPWQNNLLATGGGTSDKYIHFWNSTTGARVNSIETGSQVTSLRWSTSYKEIVSSHGFPDNQLCVWSYPSLVKTAEIPAHETRVLHSTLSPDGQVLATAAADESLKFWKIFEKKAGAAGLSALQRAEAKESEMSKQMTIR